MVEYNFKKFDMSNTNENTTIIFIGKRKSGKSQLVLDWLYHHQDIPMVVVISPTDQFTHTFSPHIPKIFIHDDINSEILKNIWERQNHLIGKIESGDPAYQHIDPRLVLILDDCLAEGNKWVNDETIKKIFMNGRHLKITIIITMQDPMGITPKLRTNVEYVFICRDPRVNNQDKIWNHYAGIFPDKVQFRTTMNKMTQDYQCMVLDNTSISYEIEECVYWYKANIFRPDFATFKLCCPKLWELNDRVLAMPPATINALDNSSVRIKLLKNPRKPRR